MCRLMVCISLNTPLLLHYQYQNKIEGIIEDNVERQVGLSLVSSSFVMIWQV